SLYSQFDGMAPEATSAAVRARLRPILQLARDNRALVNFDMEQYAFKNATLQIFREILDEPEFRDWPDVGIAIQAYLRDTPADLRQPQRPLDRPRPGRGRGTRPAATGHRVPGALRHGRPGEGRARVDGPARARLHALRPVVAGHGLPGAPAPGEYVERIIPTG